MKSLLKTDDGSLTILHKEHGQAYHSSAGALLEARSLYIDGSKIADSFDDSVECIRVLDVGLGLGYNALATIECFMSVPSRCNVELVSLENELDVFELLRLGKGEWQQNWNNQWLEWCGSIEKIENSTYKATLKNSLGSMLSWTIIISDAHDVDLKKFGLFSYIWQDPFSPEMNPSMWNASWFQKLREVSASNVKMMSYSVARIVKDACTEAGFSFERIPASGRKRHWLKVFLK